MRQKAALIEASLPLGTAAPPVRPYPQVLRYDSSRVFSHSSCDTPPVSLGLILGVQNGGAVSGR